MFPIRFMQLFVRSVARPFSYLNVRGSQNIPKTGPYIIALNHPSKVDPALVFASFPSVRMRFFVGQKWYRHPLYGPLMAWAGAIFVDESRNHLSAIKKAISELKAGTIFGLTPEGTRSREAAMLKAKDGVAFLASRAMVPVLPVGVVNSESLGRNMIQARRTNLEIRIGKIVELSFDGGRPRKGELRAYTHMIMAHIAGLLPKRYWGYYGNSPALKAILSGEDPWPYCLHAERSRSG